MLLVQIENGDDQLKAERLYVQHRHLMYSEAYKILQDRHLAEDAVQQSFVKIIKNLHKIDENNCPRTRNFLVIICVNVAKSIYNKRLYLNKQNNAIEDIDADMEDVGSNPLDILVDKDSVTRITKAIEFLSPIYRDTLLLKYAYGYSRKEIAELLEIPEETVKKRLARAIAEFEKIKIDCMLSKLI
jgi:RNA polymerase sigma-70 factor (ECF subfamily)